MHESGNLNIAQNALYIKAMRAFYAYGLKRDVMRHTVSFHSLSSLFDSLIKPIVTYGAPVWAPHENIIKHLIRDGSVNKDLKLTAKIARSMTVNEFTSNFSNGHSEPTGGHPT